MNRLLFWLGAGVLAAGIIAVVFTFAGGSDKTSIAPDKGFHATLPTKAVPLKNSEGKTVKDFYQLDLPIRKTIRTFIGTAVARQDLADSWNVVAPEVKKGYTRNEWAHAKALPIIPFPVDDLNRVQYYLRYATSREILVEVGLAPKKSAHIRPATFQLGLIPVSNGSTSRWMVNYWMPRWTPPVREG